MAVAAGAVVAIEQRRLRIEAIAAAIVRRRPDHRGSRLAGDTRRTADPGGDRPGVDSMPAALIASMSDGPPIEMHLALTRTIPEGSVDLVVWPEGSTGGLDADPDLES